LVKTPGPTGKTFFVYPLSHCCLGLLYERAGEATKAGAQYRKFLDFWKDGDPGLPEVEDARKGMAGLKAQ